MSIGVDVIVIGSGMAGLSCASTLSAAGQRVLVLERHEVVGGGAHTYAVDGKSGWKFDSGLHYTIPQAAALLALAAGRARSPVAVERMGERMAEGNVYDRIVLAGSGDAELRIATDKQVLAELKRRFPTRAAELDRFMAVCAGLLWRFPLWCLSALLPSRFRRLALGSPLFAHWRAWASRTAEAALRDLLPGDDEDSRRLRGYLSGLWIDGGCPPSRMSFFLLAATTVGFPHEGGAYPTGGSEAMALALVEAIEARGGAVRVRAHVSRVLVDGGVARGVQLADGSRVYAPIVVSATGYRMTAERLLAKDDARLAGLDARALVTAQSDGFVMCNIALRGGARELGIGCSNLWLQPCASETGGSIERGIAEYLAAPLGVDATQVPLMLTFPSVKDHGWHVDHPEHTMCQTLALAPWTWFERHRVPGADAPPRHAPPSVPRAEPAEYEALKAKWAERCVRMLSAHYPRTNGRVEFVNVSTPLTIENYLPSGAGSAIGLDVTPARFVDLDEIGRLDMRTRVSGLWLTGQDVLMCGQPLAQLSGIITAVRICGPLRTAGLAWRVLLQQLGLLG